MPMTIIAKDFDENGSVDPFISFYVRDSLGTKRNYLYHPWEDVIKQFRALRKSFNSYSAFGEATTQEIFKNQNISDALIKTASWMETSWVENLGNNKFKLHKLPKEAQWAPVFGTTTFDLNQDGYEDLLIIGNDYGVEVNQGRLDALQGLVLINDQNKSFNPQTMEQSNFIVPKNGKSLVQIDIGKQPYFVASQNNDSLKIFKPTFDLQPRMITWKRGETNCLIYSQYNTVQKRAKEERYSFQSQGTSSFWIPKQTRKIEFFDSNQKILRTEIFE